MLRLFKFLKPYRWLIVLSLGLLFVQANADLALPDYLSRIVNTGIQQNGIENAAPMAIRQSQMDKLMLVMAADEQIRVLNSYDLIEPGSAAAADYASDYPELSNQPVYVRQELPAQEIDALNPILARAFLAVSAIEQVVEDPARAEGLGDVFGFDPSLLPAGADPFALLGSLPDSQRAGMANALRQQFETLGESMTRQMSIVSVQAEYEALGVDTANLQRNYLASVGGAMLLVALLSGACTVAVGFLASRTAAGAARDIRLAAFEKVESFSSAEFDRFSTASLITRSTNDITQVQTVIFMMMRMVLYAPIIGIGGVIRAIDKSADMWWILALAVVVLLSMVAFVAAISMPKFRAMQSLIDRLNLITRENLSGMMVIRAFNKEQDEEARFETGNRELADTSLFIARVMVSVFPLIMLVMNGLTVAIIWVGAHQVAEANIQVGDMIAFMQYAIQIVFAFLMMSMMFIFLPRAAVSGGRIAEVLETETSVNDPELPHTFKTPFVPEIEFRDVSFRYPDALDDVVRNISFTARPGETTAFIGSTGCGKSTIINLIPRFYDVTEGAILVNGVDIRHVKQHDLRDKIGYVPQQGTLFSGTIESNLQFADPEASRERLEESAEIAQASAFIHAYSEGFEAPVAQGGTNVSGGQKQRLAIARALVKRPPIYIFDDSFSALDFKTDSALRRALRGRTADSTVLLVTQRVATVKSADQIIVLEEGEIVGQGSHQELMADCQTYQEIARSQLSKAELQ